MRRLSRRGLLLALGGGAAGLAGLRHALPGWLAPGKPGGVDDVGPEARRLVELAFEGVDPVRCWDSHVHVVGLGAGGTGCTVSPRMRSPWHPIQNLQFDVYLAASGVRHAEHADQEYAARLFDLQAKANPRGKLMLFAFDANVDEHGVEQPSKTSMTTPFAWVSTLAREHGTAVPVASVHPYRRDAIERLERCAQEGAVAVKWLPSAMGMDPASPLCDRFYARLAELGLPLISHGGMERAVRTPAAQELGNPLRLRRALDHGVKVVVAHCAGLGQDLDLDRPEAERAPREAFDLFLRMMREPRYEGLLFGDVSAVTLVSRSGRPLRELLCTPELHPRLVNGSDYPLPAIDPLVSAGQLARRGYLAEGEEGPLEELQSVNPLLFDFVLKRRLRVLEEGAERRFAPAVFESARLFAA